LDNVILFPKVKWRKRTGNATVISSILNKRAWNDRQTPTYVRPHDLGRNNITCITQSRFVCGHSRSDCLLHGGWQQRPAEKYVVLDLCTSCHNLSLFLYSCTTCMYCNVYISVSINCKFSCWLL
jgi:hypothetical protein